MLKAIKFKGGVHPSYQKQLTADKPIKEVPLPSVVVLPLSQHIGAPAKPIVKKGDKVKTGQLIAEASGFVSSPIHSSVSGIVKNIMQAEHPNGTMNESIIIESDGEDSWIDLETLENPLQADKDVLKKKIADAGIVGLGGATFPSHVKLSPPQDKKIDLLVINGAECEPYLTADDLLMQEYAEEILKGVEVLAYILQIKDVRIGIEKNKPKALGEMKKFAEKLGFKVVELPVKYPQGAEKQLIYAVSGRKTPPTNLPMEVGVVVFNVASSFAVYEAIYKGKPLIERIVTVTGEGIENPGNFKTRIGTYVAELVEFSGGYKDNAQKLILGGPMMGRSVATDALPIIKGTGGVLVLTEPQLIKEEYAPCIRCGRCVRACPNNHVPYYLGNLIEKGKFDRIDAESLKEIALDDCFECGSCVFVCPSNRPLVQFFQMAKSYYNAKNRKK